MQGERRPLPLGASLALQDLQAFAENVQGFPILRPKKSVHIS